LSTIHTSLRCGLLTASIALLSACSEPQSAGPGEAPTPAIEPSTPAISAAPSAPDVGVPALLDCARADRMTFLSAHRGGPGPGLPENSLAAMDASIEAGALFLEIDVAATADGALVLLHDRTLDRTTTGSGPIAEATLAEVRGLDLLDADGAVLDAPPPTLAEAFDLARGRAVLQLDVKGVSAEALAAAIREADAIDEVLVITYTTEAAIELAEIEPTLMLSVGLDSVDALDAVGAAGVRPERIVAWLGLGAGNPALDAALAARGVETSYADFRAERSMDWDYAAHAAAGAEVLSVDDVPRAAAALDARARLDALRSSCAATD